MNSKLISTRSVVIGLALLILDAGSAFAGSITLSGATGNSCLYSAFTADANGNLTAVCKTAPPPAPTLTPSCTLSASPSTISAGATSTLIASCSPAADSYVWTGAGTSGFSAGGTVTPTATTSYSVVGSNGSGAGNTASTVVSIAVPPPPNTGARSTPTTNTPVSEVKRWIYAFESRNFIPHDTKSEPYGTLSYWKLIQSAKPTQYSLPTSW